MGHCTPADLARRLALNPATVRHHIRRGHIRASKPGRDYVIPLREAVRVAATYRRHAVWAPAPDHLIQSEDRSES